MKLVDTVEHSDALTGRLVVKFRDDLYARALSTGMLSSLSNKPVGRINQVLERHGCIVSSAFNVPESRLANIQARAAALSGKAQPDLAGMMHIDCQGGDILGIAASLHALDEVEFVVVETERTVSSPGDEALPGPPTGACSLENVTPPVCVLGVTQAECTAIGGTNFQAGSSSCTFLDEILTGPCCLPPDGCFDGINALDCALAGGTYIGHDGGTPEAWFCDDPNRVSECAPDEDSSGIWNSLSGQGACCLIPGGNIDNGGCVEMDFLACRAAGGIWAVAAANDADVGDGCTNVDEDEYECGEDPCDILFWGGGTVAKSCLGSGLVTSAGCGNGVPGGPEEACCNDIAICDPFCTDWANGGVWDVFCAEQAKLLCLPSAGPFPGFGASGSPLAGSCFEQHPTPGCRDGDCCDLVMGVDLACAGAEWDAICAEYARVYCTRLGPITFDTGATPDLRPMQFSITEQAWPYATSTAFQDDMANLLPHEIRYYSGIPSTKTYVLGAPIELWGGGRGKFNGSGLDIVGEPGESFTDTNNNGWWDPGEAFLDIGPDGIPSTLIGDGGSGAQIPIPGGHLFPDFQNLGFADIGDPVVCSVVLNPLYVTTPSDIGQCDGLWNEPNGLRGFAMQLFREDSVFHDETGMLDSEPLVPGSLEGDRGDELAKGRGAKVGIIEFAYFQNHEDIRNNDLVHPDADSQIYTPRELRCINEPGQTMIMIDDLTFPDHGTASVGLLCAIDEEAYGGTAMGITGIVPEAQPYFFPIVSYEEGPRELSAWLNAIWELGPGDVISAGYQPRGPGDTIANSEELGVLIRMATDTGISCCVAAGNTAADIGEAIAGPGEDDEGTGAIVISGTTPSIGDFRHGICNLGAQVAFCSWGSQVVAPGFGDLSSSLISENPLDLQVDRNRSYTSRFGGSSAATAAIAGSTLALQGIARQFYGVPIGPEALVEVMIPFPIAEDEPASNAPNDIRLPFYGSNRGAGPDGLTVTGQPCMLDVSPAGEEANIGVFPNLDAPSDETCAVHQLLTLDATGFNDSPGLEELYVLRGDLNAGNVYSIRGEDNNPLVVASEYWYRNQMPGDPLGGAFPWSQQISRADVLVTGDVTDIMVVANAMGPPDQVTDIAVAIVHQAPVVRTFIFLEGWNWVRGDWAFLAFEDIELPEDDDEGGGFEELEFELNGAVRPFVNQHDGTIIIRLWTFGLTGFGGLSGEESYEMRYDLVRVEATIGFGQNP